MFVEKQRLKKNHSTLMVMAEEQIQRRCCVGNTFRFREQTKMYKKKIIIMK
jgi:hypothetical protein